MRVNGGKDSPAPNEKTETIPDSSSDASSTIYSSSLVDSEESDDDDGQITSIQVGSNDVKNKIVTSSQNSEIVNKIDILQHVFNASNSGQTLGNVFIEKSNGVHIGNITYVTGPIHITQAAGSTSEEPKPNSDTKSTRKARSKGEPKNMNKKLETATNSLGHMNINSKDDDSEEEVEREEVNCSDAFIGNINRAIDGNVLKIVNRVTWLAQRPLEPYEYIDGPAPYVVISHTGSEEASTQAENVYLVRNIQCFHVESRRWNDIAYNFLIGCDGNVYEGRGWRVVGAHTYGYNRKSVGISFIGCFMRDKPPEISIKACKLLIKRGVELGYIKPDYILLGHCQCSPTESPGRVLFEEIQTWSHFSLNP